MKYPLLLVALVLCSISPSLAQWVEPPMVEVATTLAGNGERFINDILIDENDNIYATGYFHGLMCYGDSCIQSLAPNSADIFVCKLDSSLKLIWLKRLGGSGIDWGLTLTKGGDGEVVLGVRFTGDLELSDTTLTSNYSNFGYGEPTDFALLNILRDGQISLAYHPLGDSFNKLEFVESNGEEIIVSGIFEKGLFKANDILQQSDDASAGESFFIILSSHMEVLEYLDLSNHDTYPVYVSKIKIAESSFYLTGVFIDTLELAGVRFFEGNGAFHFIASVDLSGKIEWVKVLPPGEFRVTDIELDQKNNLLVSGETSDIFLWDTDLIDPGGVLLNLSPDGEIIWSSQIFKPESWASYRVLDILADSRGIYTTGFFFSSLYIEDTVFNPSGNGSRVDALLLRYNVGDGQIQWTKQIGVSGDENIYRLTMNNSGNLFGLGRFNYNLTLIDTVLLLNHFPGTNTSFFFKLSSEDFFSDPNPELSNWSVFPNPADDYLCIQGKWNNSSVSIELFDLQGKRVYHHETFPVSQDELLTFPLPSMLAAGMYLIRIQQGKQTQSCKIQVSQSFP